MLYMDIGVLLSTYRLVLHRIINLGNVKLTVASKCIDIYIHQRSLKSMKNEPVKKDSKQGVVR